MINNILSLEIVCSKKYTFKWTASHKNIIIKVRFRDVQNCKIRLINISDYSFILCIFHFEMDGLEKSVRKLSKSSTNLRNLPSKKHPTKSMYTKNKLKDSFPDYLKYNTSNKIILFYFCYLIEPKNFITKQTSRELSLKRLCSYFLW